VELLTAGSFKAVCQDFGDQAQCADTAAPPSQPDACCVAVARELWFQKHRSPQHPALLGRPEKSTPVTWGIQKPPAGDEVLEEASGIHVYALSNSLLHPAYTHEPAPVAPLHFHWLQVSWKSSLTSHADLIKQGPFIYPLGEPSSSNSYSLPRCFNRAISSQGVKDSAEGPIHKRDPRST